MPAAKYYCTGVTFGTASSLKRHISAIHLKNLKNLMKTKRSSSSSSRGAE